MLHLPEIKAALEEIPYLNGGLFEPKEGDYFHGGNLNTLNVPNNLITDLFALFDEYYFTVDENTPDNQEIGVDPEMMGRIFENFILNRSSTGSFYTPREIVDYMVETSLKESLKSSLPDIPQHTIENLFDTKYWNPTEDFRKDFGTKILHSLGSLKILDPACGSGAFPMGVLQKLTEIIHTLQPDKSLYEIKLNILQNSIYGVDILPIAVEISRLRCWLSLVVDEDKNDPKPLPNLEFKFVCANSLVGLNRSLIFKESKSKFNNNPQVILGSSIEVRDDIFADNDQLDKLLHKAEHVRNQNYQPGTNKLELSKNWLDISHEIYDLNLEKIKNKDLAGLETQKIISWNPYNNESATFFDPEWMFGIPSFDIVIGNPPYVGEKGNKETFEPLKQSELGKKFYDRRIDLFYFFFHLGLDILKPNGILGFITTNYYITATGGTKLRNDFKNRSNILKMINFGELKIFESALGQHNLITILQKKPVDATTVSPLANTIITQNKGYLGSQILQNIVDGKNENTNYYQIPQTKLYDDNGYIKLTSGAIDDILDKMLVGNERLGKIYEVNQGIVTGADKVSPKHLRKYKIEAKVGDGIYVLSQEEIEKLNLTPSDSSILKSWFKNSDVTRYYISEQTEEKILYTNQLENLSDSLKTHFDKFKSILINRNIRDQSNFVNLDTYKNFVEGKVNIDYVMQKSSFKSGKYFYISYPRIKEQFESPKIVAPQRSKTNTFGYNETAWYASADVYFITQPKQNYNLKFLLGVLNSKLIYKWLYYRGKRKGEMLELYQKPLSEIPIPTLNTPEKQAIARRIEVLVEEILAIKGGEKNTPSTIVDTPQEGNLDTAYLETQIDELVFQLYGLTQEEIRVVLG